MTNYHLSHNAYGFLPYSENYFYSLKLLLLFERWEVYIDKKNPQQSKQKQKQNLGFNLIQ